MNSQDSYFVDFHKAFDVLDHNVLLKKLSVYGASPDRVAWFQEIVSRRVTTVCEGIYHLSGNLSGKGYCRDQSSVLWYFSCLWMIMPLHLNNFTIDIYADDTTLSLSVNWNNITSLIKALANDLENIEKWSTENWIVHQYQEDQSITCYGKRLQPTLRTETASLQLHLNATNINQILHHKLLGLIIDKDLSFEAHKDELCTRNCQNDFNF